MSVIPVCQTARRGVGLKQMSCSFNLCNTSIYRTISLLFGVLFLFAAMASANEPPRVTVAQTAASGIWIPDQGNGTYLNPVLQGDYSDPDVVRVGEDFYLTSSSFTNVPGLPILHSTDLVNWKIIGHALQQLEPVAHHSVPRRGGGVWAPSIRYHKNQFMIYYADPDFGVFVVTAKSAAGPWSKPKLIDTTKGVIDPCPFWEEDGKGYLVYAYAHSRSGKSNIIELKQLAADGLSVKGKGKVIIDANQLPEVKTSYGDLPWFTLEGPKLYKRNNYYYIFAPAGSVKGGWQAVFRSRNVTGPYEGRSVMDQGTTVINGPHQGAWVNTHKGEDWFIHFQQMDTYGRRVLLQPMKWLEDNWPIIGTQQGTHHFGQPVTMYKKPDVTPQPRQVPIVDDEFVQGFHKGWQWSANPMSDWVDTTIDNKLRLKSISSSKNLWEVGSLLTQKLPGMHFIARTHLTLKPNRIGERAGLLVLGYTYGWIGLENTADGIRLVQVTRENAHLHAAETTLTAPVVVNGPVYVQVHIQPVIVAQPEPDYPVIYPSLLRAYHAKVRFSYSVDGENFTEIGPGFIAQPRRWVGAQIGLFAQAASGTPAFVATSTGFADFEYFSVSAGEAK